jgi:protein TonB
MPGVPPATITARRKALPATPGLWRYPTVTRSRWVLVLSVIVSAGFHVWALLGFNDRPLPPPPRIVDDGPLLQIEMPDLHEDEEEPVESLDDAEAVETPAISVPMLADVPTIVPVNAFVQPLDFTPNLNVDPDSMRQSVIPVNIARGSGGAAKLGKIFDISQLDRQPQAVFQPPPVFPVDMRNSFSEAVVVMEFIINAKGDVVFPRAVSSPNRRFEDAASAGLLKWRFKPGYKGGRPVNTRSQITITFRITSDT